MEDDVVAKRIDVLGVNEEPVHIEQAGSDVGEPVLVLVSEGRTIMVKGS